MREFVFNSLQIFCLYDGDDDADERICLCLNFVWEVDLVEVAVEEEKVAEPFHWLLMKVLF